MRTITWMIAAMLLISGICRVPAHAAQPFLGYLERSLPSGQNFPKWNAIGDSLSQEIAAVEGCLGGAGCSSRVAGEIASRLADIDGRSQLSRAEAVQDLMNSRPYRDDRRQFGRSDVWQTPFAFWRSGGDCEDYAIAKYMALRALGFSDAQLRLTVMTGRASREVHAVLLIEIDQRWYVADNLERGLRPVEAHGGWKPEFSVSAAGAWRYVARLADAPSAAPTDRLPEPAAASQSIASDGPRSRL